MKKIILAVFVISVFGLAVQQMVMAQPGGFGGPMSGAGSGPCPNCDYRASGPGGFGGEEVKAREKFLEETLELRKELSIKQAEMAAIMNHEKPDEKKVAKLAGEIFDLRDKFRKMSGKSGVTGGFGSGACGCGGMRGGAMMGKKGMMHGRHQQGGCDKHMMRRGW